jgi:hypothetical protein
MEDRGWSVLVHLLSSILYPQNYTWPRSIRAGAPAHRGL